MRANGASLNGTSWLAWMDWSKGPVSTLCASISLYPDLLSYMNLSSTNAEVRFKRLSASGRHGGAAVELLPHSARDPGSILTTGAVCTEFGRSPHYLRGFS